MRSIIHLLQGSGTYLRHISSSLSRLKATRPSLSVQVLHNMAHFSPRGAQMGSDIPQLSYKKPERDGCHAHLAGPPTLSLRSCCQAAAMQWRAVPVRLVQHGIESSLVRHYHGLSYRKV